MGIDMNLWINFAKFLILFFMIAVIGSMWFKYFNITNKKKQKKYLKKYIKITSIIVFVWIVFFIFMFFSFDKGKPPSMTNNKKMGIYEQIQKNPDEKNLETIKKEAEDKKPSILKHMDEGFEKDRKEADDYINEVLKRSQNNE